MESRVKNTAGNYVVDTKKYLEIVGINQAKKTYQNTTPAVQTDSQQIVDNNTGMYSNMSDVDFLVNKGLIVKRESIDMYRLNDLILRQEILGVAMKIRNFQSPA